MDEKILLKISLIPSLVGILILLVILEKIDVSDSNISAIDKNLSEKQVKIKGEITRIRETPAFSMINVKDDTGNIDVVVFKEKKLELKEGDIIQVEGQVTEYQGKLEILAKRIVIL